MAEAEDFLPLHHKKPLNQCQALAMAHLHFDPVQSQPFLSAVLKFMYRYLVISSSLAEEMEGNASNFKKVLTDDFVRNLLQPAVALAIATKTGGYMFGGWGMGFSLGVGVPRIFSSALPLHWHSQGVKLPLLIVNGDE